VDLQAQYSLDLPDSMAIFSEGAQLYIDAIWTHVFSLEEQANVVNEVYECSGFFSKFCTSEVNPENRITANFDYGSGPFTARLTWRWIDGWLMPPKFYDWVSNPRCTPISARELF
jgi:hypothetical protein